MEMKKTPKKPHDYTAKFIGKPVKTGKAQARQLLHSIMKQLHLLHRSNTRNGLEENSEEARYALLKIEEAMAASRAVVILEGCAQITCDFSCGTWSHSGGWTNRHPGDSFTVVIRLTPGEKIIERVSVSRR